MGKRSLVAGALVCLVACGGSQATATDTTDKTAVDQPAAEVDLEAARAAATKIIEDQYAKIAAGDIAGYAATLAPDVFWFGSAHFEAFVGRDAVLEDLNKIFGPAAEAGATFSYQSAGVKVSVAPDGRAAWARDEVELSVPVGGNTQKVPYRVTSVLAEEGGTWTVVAQQWSVGVPNAVAFQKAAAGGWKPLAPIQNAIGPGAEPLVDSVKTIAANLSAAAATFSDRPDAFLLGSAPEEKWTGGAAIKELYEQGDPAGQYKVGISGGVVARLVPSGNLGWVACNQDVTVQVEGNAVTVPIRVLFVYLKEGDAWKIVQDRHSNGLDQ